MFYYGMRLRGYSIGCQSKGVEVRLDDNKGMRSDGRKYHDIIGYERELTDREMFQYDLDYLGETI